MKFKKTGANLYIPTRGKQTTELSHAKYLGIAAHQDDLEIIGFPGILDAYKSKNTLFGGVVCTNGVPKSSKNFEQIRKIRSEEQKRASDIGKYGFVLQLGYSSTEITDKDNKDIESDIIKIVQKTKPKIIYTHNPFDKHKTHTAVCRAVINSLRSLKEDYKPEKLYACEVWRNLDWLDTKDRVEFDVNNSAEFATKLIEVFDSQIRNEKNYKKAVIARRTANATFSDAYSKDKTDQLIIGLDLTPLIIDNTLNIKDYLLEIVDRFRDDIRENLKQLF